MDPKIAKLLTSDDAFASTLVVLLIDSFGTEALTWTPKAMIMELEDMYRVKPSQATIDRLMCGVHLATSNSFYVSLPDFNEMCSVLSGELATPGMWEPADAASIAWGITEALLLSPPDDMDKAFTNDIRAFIGAILDREGILTPPDVLKIAHINKERLAKVSYDFSDDESMFQAIFEAEKTKTDDINDFVKTRLKGLLVQLAELKLLNGKTEGLAEQLLIQLPEPNQDSVLA